MNNMSEYTLPQSPQSVTATHHLIDCDLFEELRNDDIYKTFLSDTFDAKSMPLVHGITINDQILKITSGIEIINKNLHSFICDKYEDLLAQSTKVDTLEDVLKMIQTKIQALLLAIEKIRAKLVEPFNRNSQQMILLSRLQCTCDLLRKMIRIIHLSKRLEQSKLEDNDIQVVNREITKAAQYINEIEIILSEDDTLKRINIIQSDISRLKHYKSIVIKQANNILESGLTKLDATQVGSALQVFYSIKLLNSKLEQISKEKQDFVTNAVKSAIDVTLVNQNKNVSGPGRVVMTITVGQNASFRSTLRSNIDSLLENIFVAFSQMSLIYKIIKKKRDPITQVCFIDDISNADGLNEFWSHVTTSLSEQLCKAANDSNVLKQALEGEYPKLLSSFSELWKRINREDKEINAEKVLRLAMQPFESAYLSRSLSLLFDSVNRVFADAKDSSSMGSSLVLTAPSVEDIDTILKNISKELHVASVDSVLSKSVAKNVSKCIHLFVNKCEQLTSVDGDSTQVIGPLTQSQLLNATLAHRLEEFRIQLNSLLASCNCIPETIAIMELSLNSIESLMLNSINPIMSSVEEAVEAIILTMHNEDYSSEEDASDAQCSLYMRELQSFIARVTSDYFKQLPDCKVIQKCINKVANRTIELFLRHITLIRPVSNCGKMKIAADFAQLEMAITPLCTNIGDLGKTYRTLRSFKQLLFQNAETISKSAAVGDLIPYSLILQFLISLFAPNDIKSAHESHGWSLTRYSKWLDNHQSEAERLALIKNSLESYVKQIRLQQGKEFASVYPLLLELLQKALQ